MLQTIRDHIKGWIATVIIGLLTIPFALWGINEYFSYTREGFVARVNDVEIPPASLREEYQAQVDRLRQILGDQFDTALFDEKRMRRETLDRMIAREVLRQHLIAHDYRIADEMLSEEIRRHPAFQVAGKFDLQTYRNRLAAENLTPAGFEERWREALGLQQLQDAITRSEFATPAELEREIALRGQQREVSIVQVPAARYQGGVEVTEQEVAAYYEANKGRYLTEETVDIEYLELDATGLDADLVIDDEVLRDMYQQEQDRQQQAEQRLARHILVAIKGDEAAARKKAEDLLARVRAGEDFAALAREHSDDAGSASAGGDLGWVQRGQLVGPFEDALFALQSKGAVSDIIKTEFGFHIIRLEDVRVQQSEPFEAVRERLAAEYRKREIDARFYERAERLTDLAYSNPDSLAPAAKALGLTIQRVANVTRRGGEGIAANAAIREAAFSASVLEEGVNSKPLELGHNHVVVLRVAERRPPVPRPLAEVREEVRAALLREKASQLARDAAQRITDALRAGLPMTQVAAREGLTATPPRFVERSDAALDPALAAAVFAAARPVEGKATVDVVALPQGDFAVFALTAVRPGSLASLDEATRQVRMRELARRFGQTAFSAYVEELRRNADIVIREDQIE